MKKLLTISALILTLISCDEPEKEKMVSLTQKQYVQLMTRSWQKGVLAEQKFCLDALKGVEFNLDAQYRFDSLEINHELIWLLK